MAKSLGSFRAAVLIGWGALGTAGIMYARWRGLPMPVALPFLAALLIVYPFYLVPAFPSARDRVSARQIPFFALGAFLLPYLAVCCGALPFDGVGLLKLTAAALLVGIWFLVLPRSPLTDVGFLGLVAAVLLARYFNPIFVPVDPPLYKDLKNLVVLPHLSLIAAAVMALLVERRVPETGYGFVPSGRELRIGLLHFAYFVPIALPLALLLQATHFATTPKPVPYIVGSLILMFCVVALSEEFFVRGVLQQWIEDWSGSRMSALLISSALFGLLHLWMPGLPFPNWRWALIAGILGFFCGRARNQAGSIRASMVTHALVATTWRAFFL